MSRNIFAQYSHDDDYVLTTNGLDGGGNARTVRNFVLA
jgi:hypothetical protein